MGHAVIHSLLSDADEILHENFKQANYSKCYLAPTLSRRIPYVVSDAPLTGTAAILAAATRHEGSVPSALTFV